MLAFAAIIFASVAVGLAEAIQIRDNLSNVVASLTSVAGSAYSQATAEAVSYYSDGLSAASVGAQEGLSDASTWITAHSAASVVTTAISVSGVAESIVTSIGGPAITLATSSGVATSFAGSQYTVIASATSTTNAAMSVHSIALTAPPVLTALVTVVGGTLLGAWLTW